jgi:hypothetical protein
MTMMAMAMVMVMTSSSSLLNDGCNYDHRQCRHDDDKGDVDDSVVDDGADRERRHDTPRAAADRGELVDAAGCAAMAALIAEVLS